MVNSASCNPPGRMSRRNRTSTPGPPHVEEVTDLRQHGGWNQQRLVEGLEQPRRGVVVCVCGLGSGDEDVGVDEGSLAAEASLQVLVSTGGQVRGTTVHRTDKVEFPAGGPGRIFTA